MHFKTPFMQYKACYKNIYFIFAIYQRFLHYLSKHKTKMEYKIAKANIMFAFSEQIF